MSGNDGPWLEGETALLTCSVTDAVPAPISFSWIITDVEIGETSETLSIPQLTREFNNRDVTCFANNILGQVESEPTTLVVHCKEQQV